MEEYIICLHPSGILEWKINRPNKRNAINFNGIKGLEQAIEKAKDPEVKALVITGAGEDAFCSGGDIKEFHHIKTEERAFDMLSTMGKNLYHLATLPKPTLALINGVAVGGGCELATACDFRLAKSESKMGFIQGKLAITTGWGGASLLFEKLDSSVALKILGEANVFEVEFFKKIGFIHEVYTELNITVAEEFLKDLLKTNVHVINSYKQSLVKKWENSSLEGRMIEEIRQCAILWEKDAHHKAVEEFLSSR